ncbi:DUF5682 family protein [Streptomyces sp. NPDC005963]|uniref:DUF5682 family protein n=1 Tax=Streptomyces sp. NPDC005963 TaxID=3156721 RepID=UPI0033F0BC9C
MTGPLLLGVRHHGPGSARAVRAALDAARPAAVLIEGPPEANDLIALAAEEGMRPPVALLAHAVDDPGRAAFWPLAEFSPEWVAIRWALARGVPVRFIDLPAAHSLALAAEEEQQRESGGGPMPFGGESADEDSGRPSQPEALVDTPGTTAAEPECAPSADREEEGEAGPASQGAPANTARAAEAEVRIDPLTVLAETAGYDDPERWWEDVVEHRGAPAAPEFAQGERSLSAPAPGGSLSGAREGRGSDPLAAFEVLGEAMAALRETYGHGGHHRDLVREAHMRLQLRSARKEFGDGVAVVCGAWHVPALSERTTLAADRAVLKGLPKIKTEMTWVPWTHRRLSRHSGYGAGIDSPGWYQHLFHTHERPIERWLVKVAELLRKEDQLVSSAHVIEAVRLAQTLAVLRGRPLAGLAETTDAIRAVMCDGSDIPLQLIKDRLTVGDVLGAVPDGAPAVPLQRDLARAQRRLRLKPEAAERQLELDLRSEGDAARSRLLHRLLLLSVEWGEPRAGRASTGTFREGWRLRWEPELFVRVAEAGVWGTTVLSAATAKAEHRALSATTLREITALAEECLLAELTDALPVVMRALADRAALDTDVGHLAEALPALARALRYGDVRATDTAALGEVATGLAQRICVGLPPACSGLDGDGATAMRLHLDAVHTAVGLLPTADELAGRWHSTLVRLASRDSVPGLLRGRAARLLLDDGQLEETEAARLMSLALSRSAPPAEAAAWIEGFVGGASGGGLLLVHDERLRGLVDTWLSGVSADAFTDVLPLLRRTFAAYEPPVRRTLGELVRRSPADRKVRGRGARGLDATGSDGFGAGIDEPRADAVLPLLRLILGTGERECATTVGHVGGEPTMADPFTAEAPAARPETGTGITGVSRGTSTGITSGTTTGAGARKSVGTGSGPGTSVRTGAREVSVIREVGVR